MFPDGVPALDAESRLSLFAYPSRFVRSFVCLAAFLSVSACSVDTVRLPAPEVDNPLSLRSHPAFARMDLTSFGLLYAEFENTGREGFHSAPVGDFLAYELFRKYMESLESGRVTQISLTGFSLRCVSEGGILPHALCSGMIALSATSTSGVEIPLMSELKEFDVGNMIILKYGESPTIATETKIRPALEQLLMRLPGLP